MSKLNRIIWNIWVTGRCNLECKYCYIAGAKKDTSFNPAEIQNLINFIVTHSADYNQLVVNFMGGEPLLEFLLIRDIVHALLNKWHSRVMFSLTTNGILVDDEMIEFFKDYRFVISLSWDGCKEINDLYRIDKKGNGTYYRILETYNKFRKQEFGNIRIRSTFNSNSINYLKESIDTFLHLDESINAVFIPDYFDVGWNHESLGKIKLIREEVNNNSGNRITIIGRSDLRINTCSGGVQSFHIYCDGKVYPCSYVVDIPEYIIGDIKYGLDKEKICGFSERYSSRIDECIGCDYERYCLTYKCRYLNLILSGNMNKPSPIVCQMENIKMCNGVIMKER